MDPEYGDTIEFSARTPSTPRDTAHYLVAVEGGTPGARREIPERLTLGRASTCRLRLDDPGVSKVHCRLRFEGSRVIVEDAGSTNGTYVEGRRIEGPTELEPEGLLQVGAHVFRHEVRSRRDVEASSELARDLERARAYVRALLPAPIASGRVRTSWVYEPSAALGGDLLGYHRLDEHTLAFYLLDVCGHGVGPAMHSVSVANTLRARTLPDADFRSPASVLRALNRAFRMEDHGDLFLTLGYGVFDERAWRLAYGSAGHPPAFLLGEPGGTVLRLGERNPPIGVADDAEFDEVSVEPPPSSRLVLYSDGAYEVEAGPGRTWSLGEFETLVAGTAGPEAAEPARLRGAVSAVAAREAFEDDFSILQVAFGEPFGGEAG